MKLLRLIRTAILLLRTGGVWADGGEWTPDDALALGTFLRSHTGQKLAAKLRNSALSLNASAVQHSDPWRNGQATGYMQAITDLQVSAEGAPQVAQTSEEAAQGADGSLEHLAP